jgi:ElaB/YqjD/DUF883 family membrane-anchored ribosome-binding protein
MAETTEVVQQDIDETRNNLADKLAVLSDKITGTVENVGETVSNVTEKATETVETVKETVSGTVEAVKDTVQGTVETVKDTVSCTVEAIRDTFDLRKQAEQRPWLVFGGAVALGFVGGKLLSSFTAPAEHNPSYASAYGGGRPESDAYRSVAESAQPQQAPKAAEEQPKGESWFGSLTHSIGAKLGPELNTLKELALGSLFGVVRDMVTRTLPESVKGDVSNVINNMTESLGGKTIQGPVLGESDEGQEQGNQKHQQDSGREEQSRTGGQSSQEQHRSGRSQRAAEHSYR